MILPPGKFWLMEYLCLGTTLPIIARVFRLSVKNRRATPPLCADSSLYQGTIRFNILIGANREVIQEEIDNACKDANVYSLFIVLTIDIRIHSEPSVWI